MAGRDGGARGAGERAPERSEAGAGPISEAPGARGASTAAAHGPGAPCAMGLMELRGVSFRYPGADAPAVDALDLVLPPAGLVAVLGGNGSGKSTLARLISGLLVPDTGTVLVGGYDTRDADGRARVRRLVGTVFQNPDNQIVAPVVEDDVAFGPENLGLPPEEIGARIGRALAAVGMSDHRRSDPHRLSGGQKQRVAIAGILALDPRCVCLDEPTSLLDPASRAEVGRVVRDLAAARHLVVLITHHAAEAVAADRVLVLGAGRVLADGSPTDVFGAPERLRRWGVEPPPAVTVWAALRARGLLGAEPCLRMDDVVRRLGRPPEARTGPGAGDPERSVAPDATRPAGPAPDPAHAPRGVALAHVRYTYADPALPRAARRPALDGFGIRVAAGECVALLGRSGSGKSTVALHCAAILRPDGGVVTIDGVDPWLVRGRGARARALQAVRRRCGLVFQHPEEQFFEERVLDEVAFAPRNFGATREQASAAARDALALAGVPAEVAGRSPFELSGGQMRRVAIAAVLAARPAYLVLDEPTAGLDADGRAGVTALVRRLRAAGVGILLITHRMEEAAALADRAAVIQDGRLVGSGPVREVFAQAARLGAWGLEPPDGAALLAALRARGWAVPDGVLSLDEAVAAIVAAGARRAAQGGEEPRSPA